MIPLKRFDDFPQTGGCSGGLGAFRFLFKQQVAGQGAGRFMAKWIAAEKVRARLRHTVVCLNVTGRTKERIAQSESVRADSLDIVH